MPFTDEATVVVRAGRGGDGSASFHRETYRPKGGPDGGNGGRGGDVVLEVSGDVFDLSSLANHPHQRAEDGEHGRGNDRHGADGRDLVVPVPDGTVVRDERGPVADLVGPGARAVVARGGRGGRGNASLASARDRAPRRAERGEPAEERRLELELRLVADVGLVGLPNAGKSTLLARLTAAKPKVADYPFTTLSPNLGVAGDEPRFVLADVPGLVEGAAQGKGLGYRFLRHVSRCRALCHVVDVSSEDPARDLKAVRAEVEAYDRGLGERPWIVAGTKRDLMSEEDLARRLESLGRMGRVVPVSGVTGEGIEELMERLAALVEGAPAPDREPSVVLRPGRDPFVVHRKSDRLWVVEGRQVERWVQDANLEDPEEVVRLQDRIRKHGVERRLAEAGAERGDEVVIAGRTFEFIPEDG